MISEEEKIRRAREIFYKRGMVSTLSDGLLAYLLLLDEELGEEDLLSICDDRFCPSCKAPLQLRDLEPGESNSYSSAWSCPTCGHHEFNKDGKQTIIDKRDRLRKYCRRLGNSLTAGFPLCEKCGKRMAFYQLPPKGRENRYGYAAYWYCPDNCTEFFSYKTPNELIKERKNAVSKVS